MTIEDLGKTEARKYVPMCLYSVQKTGIGTIGCLESNSASHKKSKIAVFGLEQAAFMLLMIWGQIPGSGWAWGDLAGFENTAPLGHALAVSGCN